MSSQQSVQTSTATTTITNGPKDNDQAFIGWWFPSETGKSSKALDCSSPNIWYTSDSYAGCCGSSEKCSPYTDCDGDSGIVEAGTTLAW